MAGDLMELLGESKEQTITLMKRALFIIKENSEV
jgi:hypothetical protein